MGRVKLKCTKGKKRSVEKAKYKMDVGKGEGTRCLGRKRLMGGG